MHSENGRFYNFDIEYDVIGKSFWVQILAQFT